MTTHNEPARLAASPEDYARFKLARRHIEQWEDGLRLDPGAPNIEWWYFDCLLDDGDNVAVVFCTKHASRARQPLEPLIEIDLDLPDGRRFMKYGRFKADEFQAAKDGCDVRMGKYRFVGDLHEYAITAAAEDLSAEVRLEATTEPWRPETGHMHDGLRPGEVIHDPVAVRHGPCDHALSCRANGGPARGPALRPIAPRCWRPPER